MADNPFDPPKDWTSPASDVPSTPASEATSNSGTNTPASSEVADSAAESVAAEKGEKEELQQEVARILTEHGNLESNIGVNHPYWGLQNRLRALNQK